jgi:flavin-dependent dehydrogenase
MHTSRTETHDVVVVGARCAGASTAMLLARQGVDVLVVDRADLPSDVLSTHAISRGGIVQLGRWGLLDEVVASGAPQVRKMSIHMAGKPPIVKVPKDRAGVDHMMAPRRYVLDEIVLDAARRAGASVQTGVSVADVLTDRTGRVNGIRGRDRDGGTCRIQARVVVGADGVRSRIARAVKAPVIDRRKSEASTLYGYVAGLDADGFEFHVGDNGFAGVFLTHHGEANVFACIPTELVRRGSARQAGFLDMLGAVSPSLADRVRAGMITSPVRSAVNLPNQVLQSSGPGWALVGDAGYHRDPVTGHGITDAFRDAELLASHLASALGGESSEASAMASYEADRQLWLQPIFELTCRMASFPPVAEFSDLQRELSVLFELEAEWLSSRPLIPERDAVAA